MKLGRTPVAEDLLYRYDVNNNNNNDIMTTETFIRKRHFRCGIRTERGETS